MERVYPASLMTKVDGDYELHMNRAFRYNYKGK
jgi:hypothetical protein